MSTNQSRPKALGLALLLAMASLLAGCSNSLQQRSIERSDQQEHALRERAMYQNDR